MTAPRKKPHMTLGAFFHPTGNHVAAWLHPESQIDAGINFEHYVELAQMAERSKFDLIFLADASATRHGRLEALSRWPQYMAYFDPLSLLNGIAARTSRIGLLATASTSYNEPYNLARRFASLDLISRGRAGWNVVTSANPREAQNFGRDIHDEQGARYERAREFVEVARGLWDSWDDDAFVRDRASAVYFDPEKLHMLNHKGKHFSVKGPLNAARPPQGYPVLAHAGASEFTLELAAEIAEVMFTSLLSLEQAQAFYGNLKGRMAKFGRDPEDLNIMPGLNPIVGRTEEEAEEKHQYLQSLIHPDVGRELLSSDLAGFDLSSYSVDGPLPYDLLDKHPGVNAGSLAGILPAARAQGSTIRQVYQHYAGARGQRTVKGTPRHIADEMEQWFLERGVDGFLVQPATLPGGLRDFCDLVIPELQRRGLFRTEYEGTTLRAHLGVPRPAGRYQ